MNRCPVCSREQDGFFRRVSVLNPVQFCSECAAQLEKMDGPVLVLVIGALVTAMNAPREGQSL